jgi:hypothetical protein
VGDDGVSKWPVEVIPDDDELFMRVHRRWFNEAGDLDAGCFQNHPKKSGGMSTDWSRYSTPGETRRRAQRSEPADNVVVALSVGRIRVIPGQTVIHAPIQDEPDSADNRAHTEVFGPKNAETRIHFLRAYRLEISLDVP